MKQLLISATASALLAGSALAADLPVYNPVPEAPIVAPVTAYTWTGFYAGLSVGGYWGGGGDGFTICGDAEPFSGKTDDDVFDEDTRLEFCEIETEDDDDVIFYRSTDDDGHHGGVLANLHAGYNWQAGSFVFGAEGELKYLFDRDDGEEIEFAIFDDYDLQNIDAEGVGTARFDNGTDWLGLATLRAGVVFGDLSQFLAYAKGGLAFSDGGGFEGECASEGDDDPDFECSFDSSDDDHDWNVGWTLGAGLEYRISQNFSVGAEYLYVDLNHGDSDVTLRWDDDESDAGEIDFSSDADDNLHLIELRATYHFGG